MIQPLPLEVLYQTGFQLYALIHGVVSGARQVWNPTLNSGAGGWEVYNSAHWSQYAIALTEDPSSGYYAATYPANISGVITSEAFYVRGGGSPTLGDAPAANLAHTQGQNLTGVAGDVASSSNLEQSSLSMQRGACAGVPTATVIPTNLSNAQTNAYAGRSIIFTSGAAFQCAARIISYTVTNGVLTLSAPLPVVPSANDTFVIV